MGEGAAWGGWVCVLGWVMFTSSIAEVGADPVAGAGTVKYNCTGAFSVMQGDSSWAGRRATGRTVVSGAVLAGGLSDMVI